MQAGLNSDDEFITPEDRAAKNLVQQMDDLALRNVLSTKHGRRWAWQMLGKCGLAMNAFSADPYVTAFNNGRQSVAQELLVDIDRVRPGSYIAMINEAKEEEHYVRPSSTSVSSSTGSDSGEFNSITSLAGDTSD